VKTSFGEFTTTASATRLIQEQQGETSGPDTVVSGYVFGPPTWKARVGENWTLSGWSASLFGNYISGETDLAQVPSAKVDSFTTFDGQVAYHASLLGGVRVAVSVLNMFDRDPPHLAASSSVIYGFGYDNANYSPFGRQITLTASVNW
jgi:iron complex outermembrane recepter protein